MSSYLRSVVTWGERQTHRECVRRVSNSSRTYISIYMAIIWGSGEGSVGGRGRGWGLFGAGFRWMLWSESVGISSSQWASCARVDAAVGRSNSVGIFGHHHAQRT